MSALITTIEDDYEKRQFGEPAEADAAFQQALAEASHNALFVAVVSGLGRILRTTIDAQLRTRPGAGSVRHHRLGLQAVVDHSPERARDLTREHLRYSRTERLTA